MIFKSKYGTINWRYPNLKEAFKIMSLLGDNNMIDIIDVMLELIESHDLKINGKKVDKIADRHELVMDMSQLSSQVITEMNKSVEKKS